MTREIKFRAWDTVEKKMRIEALEVKDIGLGSGSVIASLEVQTDNPLQWMQFTGERDCVGREIYEGDFIKIFNRLVSAVPNLPDESFHLAKISRETAEFIAIDVKSGGTWHYGVWYKSEVVGNVYENKIEDLKK